MITEKELLSKIDEDELISFLQKLVRSNSENPPGNERGSAQLIADLARGFGCSVELQEVEPGRPNVIATLEGDEPENMLFNGHTDTVKIGNTEKWTHDPLAGEIEDGYLYGRGSADMKAGLAAQLFAMKALADSGIPRKRSVMFTGVIDEEVFFKGTKALISAGKLRHCKVGYVSEPSNLKIVVRQKGGIEYIAKTYGKYAHSGAAFLGQNAILRMNNVLNALDLYNRDLQSRMDLPVLRYPTVNVGVIRGGTGVTFVPDLCEIEFDRQVLPGETVEQADREVREVISRVRKTHKIKVDLIKSQHFNTWEVSKTEPVIRYLSRAAEQVRGRRPAFTGINGYCEVELLAAHGIPSVVFGPGDIHTAHAPDERVKTQEVVDAARIYALLACEFAAATA
ncbi:MAG: M20 family metallopeptidase [Spirochaetaceae bacterium]|nr:MAG: M20 family metallopeptidase [Spirochaetaceae bacterium]